jgi:glycerol-3-phosphate dehydrogenase
MWHITRETATAAEEKYDLIIIGGGIYGVTLALEASRRGLRSLLIEKNDFGGGASFNSLRILHGGLRYLQSLDLPRFMESTRERRWFMRSFPHLVKPLPCLMPLYGNGLRRPFILHKALLLNDLLTRKRNHGIQRDRRLPSGKIVDADTTIDIFPQVVKEGLKGGAIWYDAVMPSSQRVVIDILRWACSYGATALNYVEVYGLLKSRQGVEGVAAIDRESRTSYDYRAPVVVNAAGPWRRKMAARLYRDNDALLHSSIAWNVLLNRPPLSDHALAVAPNKPEGQTYFLLPWNGKILAGTGHAPWYGSPDEEQPMPTNEQVREFLNGLNMAAPGLHVSHNDVLHIFSGLLPVVEPGSTSLAVREVILDHSEHGGPQGLYSISGVKFTTARLVAEKTLDRIFPNAGILDYEPSEDFLPPWDEQGFRGIFGSNPDMEINQTEIGREAWGSTLKTLIHEESVQHLDDLVFRRTSLWESPDSAIAVASIVCKIMDWDEIRSFRETKMLEQKLGNEKKGRQPHTRKAGIGSGVINR